MHSTAYICSLSGLLGQSPDNARFSRADSQRIVSPAFSDFLRGFLSSNKGQLTADNSCGGENRRPTAIGGHAPPNAYTTQCVSINGPKGAGKGQGEWAQGDTKRNMPPLRLSSKGPSKKVLGLPGQLTSNSANSSKGVVNFNMLPVFRIVLFQV